MLKYEKDYLVGFNLDQADADDTSLGIHIDSWREAILAGGAGDDVYKNADKTKRKLTCLPTQTIASPASIGIHRIAKVNPYQKVQGYGDKLPKAA